MSDFIKFPRTPHLFTCSDVSIRSEKVLTEEERNSFLSGPIIVEEKVDGANLGIWFDTEGNLRLQNRGGLLDPPYGGQWNPVLSWVNSKIDLLFDAIGHTLILFGEWCYAKHSVSYDLLPDWFLAFDVFDRSTGDFWSVDRRNELLEECRVSGIPELARGTFSVTQLQQLLSRSSISHGLAEGLYLRKEASGRLKERAKLVRPSFIQSIDEHWSRLDVEPNRLAAERIE